GTWSQTGDLVNGRQVHTATLLTNGKVLVAGGYDSVFGYSAELYDPSQGGWTLTGSFNEGRQNGFTATLLPNGKVLVAAGYTNDYSRTAELYDSATGTWALTGSLNTDRVFHTATLLTNGKVLVAGGNSSSRTLRSA